LSVEKTSVLNENLIDEKDVWIKNPAMIFERLPKSNSSG
jgi:hypothetical protein